MVCFQVLIFSQMTKILDLMDYYFSEKGFQVCRIDGSVKLEERRRQVGACKPPLNCVLFFILRNKALSLLLC